MTDLLSFLDVCIKTFTADMNAHMLTPAHTLLSPSVTARRMMMMAHVVFVGGRSLWRKCKLHNSNL